MKFCECFGIWILELCFFLDGGVWKLWNLRYFLCEHVFFAVLCFHVLLFICLTLFICLIFWLIFVYIISRFFKLLDIDKPILFVSHIFTTKSGPHYKIRTPLQNQDLEPFLSLNNKAKNQQIEPLQNGLSSLKLKSSSILHCCFPTKFLISYSSLGYLAGGDGALSDGLWFEKKGWPPHFVESWLVVKSARTWFCREVLGGASWETRFVTTKSGVQPLQANS